jgi:ketosteroid isomerase-like protein
MYSWIVGRVVRGLVGRVNAGDVSTIVRMFADDAVLAFPGTSSFAGEHRGRDEIESWFSRFLALRPNLMVHDVAVAGPPWNMRILFRFSDSIAIPGGGRYENEGMEYLRIRWGKAREQRVYLDTEKVAELDRQLLAIST